MYISASDFFQIKSDYYFYLYIRNLENSRLKPVFCTQYQFVFVLANVFHCLGIFNPLNIFSMHESCSKSDT